MPSSRSGDLYRSQKPSESPANANTASPTTSQAGRITLRSRLELERLMNVLSSRIGRQQGEQETAWQPAFGRKKPRGQRGGHPIFLHDVEIRQGRALGMGREH